MIGYHALHRAFFFTAVERLESRIAPAFINAPKISNLNGLNGFQLDGVAAFDFAGRSVSGAGDINGDGFDDVIVGAGGANAKGSSYVLFGRASGFNASLNLAAIDGTNGFRLDGPAYSVSGAGDVNGDGFDDLIMGRSSANPDGLEYAGSCCVFFGKAGGFSAVVALSSLDGTNGFRMPGVVSYDGAGSSVSGAGDINGDGFDDIIIGAVGSGPTGDSTAGSGYVVFGRAEGFPAVFQLSELDGVNGFRIDAPRGKEAGMDVSGAGDINGDGFADLIIGASGSNGASREPGSSYVIFGKANGFKAVVDLSILDGTDGFRVDGVRDGDEFGYSVSRVGDINADGFDDVIIGAPFVIAGPFLAGASFVIFGRSSGFAPVFNVSELDGTNGFRIDGVRDQSGDSVSGAGDVNGDGFDDVIIGADGASPNGVDAAGSAFVLFGKAHGFDAVVSLSDFGGTFGFRLDGLASNGRLGLAVSGAGDINGDGFDDVIVAAPQADPNGNSYAGSSYVVFGRPTHTVTFADVDGDMVTVKVNQGTLSPDNFTITPAGSLHGGIFSEFDLSHDAAQFAGADVTITAKRVPLGGDGVVDLGFLNAGNIDLGTVTIDGNLEHVDAGSVLKLEANFLGFPGEQMPSEIADNLASHFNGNLGVLKVIGSVHNSVLHVSGDLGRLKVGVNLEGSTVTVLGNLAPADPQAAQTIDTIMIGFHFDHSHLLVGYNSAGDAVNPDVRVGKVRVGGNWIASDFIIGASAGADDLFGTDDDLLIGGGNSIIARVAGIVIKGTAVGTADDTDHYGIVAESIGKLKVGSELFPFTLGARNDLAGFSLGTTLDLTVREVT